MLGLSIADAAHSACRADRLPLPSANPPMRGIPRPARCPWVRRSGRTVYRQSAFHRTRQLNAIGCRRGIAERDRVYAQHPTGAKGRSSEEAIRLKTVFLRFDGAGCRASDAASISSRKATFDQPSAVASARINGSDRASLKVNSACCAIFASFVGRSTHCLTAVQRDVTTR